MNKSIEAAGIAELTRAIKEKVSLNNLPVGVSLIKDEQDIPAKAKRPSKRGMTWPLCLSENMVRVLGWTIALTQEDHFCIYAAAGLGQINLPDYMKDGAVGAQHTDDLQAGKLMQEQIEKSFLPAGSTSGVMLTPANKPLFAPQAVFFYGNPTQIGKIAKGVAWYRGEPVYGEAGGFGCCVVATAAGIRDKIPRIILPAAGAKILGHCEENEVFISIPSEDLPHVLEGMEATDFLLPYPTAKYLMFEPSRMLKGYPIDLLSRQKYTRWTTGGQIAASEN